MRFNDCLGALVRSAFWASTSLFFPREVFAKAPTPIKQVSRLAALGLTQTLTPEQLKRLHAHEAGKAALPVLDVQPLTTGQMSTIRGRGASRYAYFNGQLPWNRSFHNVTINNGNVFQSFTDIKVQPGRGQGLALARTYNSNDDNVGPFGIGWTQAYDITIQEQPAQVVSGVETDTVLRKDFFGGKHSYTRDADGLYSPPPGLFDEMSSQYANELANGPQRSSQDTQVGTDGTVKHFIPNGTDATGNISPTRACDYIQDRYGNKTTLTYGQAITNADGSTQNLLTKVTDPVGRTLIYTWTNEGTTAVPASHLAALGETGDIGAATAGARATGGVREPWTTARAPRYSGSGPDPRGPVVSAGRGHGTCIRTGCASRSIP